MDKSWDHPWTTEEMRRKRREWSLAGDAGLLKHLQQFSDVSLKFNTVYLTKQHILKSYTGFIYINNIFYRM